MIATSLIWGKWRIVKNENNHVAFIGDHFCFVCLKPPRAFDVTKEPTPAVRHPTFIYPRRAKRKAHRPNWDVKHISEEFQPKFPRPANLATMATSTKFDDKLPSLPNYVKLFPKHPSRWRQSAKNGFCAFGDHRGLDQHNFSSFHNSASILFD